MRLLISDETGDLLAIDTDSENVMLCHNDGGAHTRMLHMLTSAIALIGESDVQKLHKLLSVGNMTVVDGRGVTHDDKIVSLADRRGPAKIHPLKRDDDNDMA